MKRGDLHVVLHTIISIVLPLFPAFACLIFPDFCFPFVDTGFLHWGEGTTNWHPVVQFASNAFFSWKADWLFVKLSGPIGIELYFALVFIVLSEGVYFLFQALYPERHRLSVLPAVVSVLVCSILLLLFGFDTVVLPSICWLPWQLIVLKRLTEGSKNVVFHLIALFCISLLLARSANQFTFFLSLCSMLLVVGSEFSARRIPYFSTLSIIIIPGIVALFLAPFPELPEYPPSANLAPDLGTLEGMRPLLGPEPAVRFLDQTFVRKLAAPFSLVLVLAFIVFRLVQSHIEFDRNLLRSKILWLGFGLAVCCLLDSELVSITAGQLMPLQVMRRIIPGYIVTTLFPLTLSVATIFLVIGFTAAGPRGVAVALVMGLCLYFVPIRDNTGRVLPKLRHPQDESPWNALRAGPTRDDREAILTKLNSPSYYAYKTHTVESFPRENGTTVTVRAFSAFKPRLAASSSSTQLALVHDGKRDTRWSAGHGRQIGGEWIHLFFDRPKPHRGIVLSLGDFQTDYPRGLAVYQSTACKPEDQTFENYHLLLELNPWVGPLEFTARGYPFFGQHKKMRIFYGRQIEPKCLLIKQIGYDPHYDWSIAELRFIQ